MSNDKKLTPQEIEAIKKEKEAIVKAAITIKK